VVRYTWRGFGSDCESELTRVSRDYAMADERRVPGDCDGRARHTDQTVPVTMDQIDGKYLTAHRIHIASLLHKVVSSKSRFFVCSLNHTESLMGF
jgi:hypothetical protein